MLDFNITKGYRLAVTTALLLVTSCVSAYCLPFENIVDFTADGIDDGVSYQTMWSGGIFTHDLSSLWSSGAAFQSASITLTYKMDSASAASLWYIDADGSQQYQIGQLNRSRVVGQWLSDSFNLADGPIGFMNGTGQLVVRFRETPDGVPDSIMLDKSVLTGQYEPAHLPEASSLMLAAMGLSPVLMTIRRFKK